MENFISKKELAKKLELTIGSINNYMKKGMPYHKLDYIVRFKLSEVEIWLEQRRK